GRSSSAHGRSHARTRSARRSSTRSTRSSPGRIPTRSPEVPGYSAFARFYDDVQGDRAEALPFVLPQLAGASTVLELACGTGSILAHLHDDFEVTGVDLSPEMPEFDDWERLFDTAVAHLRPGGTFVFDVNSEERLDWFAQQPAVALDFGERNVAIVDVVDGGGRIRNWELRFFEHVDGDRYRLSREVIAEVAFPEAQVRAALEARFAEVDVVEDNGRLWFTC